MHWRRKWQPTPVFCLENPRDGGAWWAAFYGVAQSRTQLKQLSSSNSSSSSSLHSAHMDSTNTTNFINVLEEMERANSLGKALMLAKIEGRRRRGYQDEMVGWHHQLDRYEFEHASGVGNGQGNLACCSPQCYKELGITE